MSVLADLRQVSPGPAPARAHGLLSEDQAMATIEALLRHRSDTGMWWASLARSVDDLTDVMWEHRAIAEGPGGLHAEVVAEQPRLAFQVRRLERDHAELVDDLARLRRLVGTCMGRTGGVAVALEAATDVVVRVRRHQRRARTMVHEAYERDLGGVD